jgi:hypothetical protein
MINLKTLNVSIDPLIIIKGRKCPDLAMQINSLSKYLRRRSKLGRRLTRNQMMRIKQENSLINFLKLRSNSFLLGTFSMTLKKILFLNSKKTRL